MTRLANLGANQFIRNLLIKFYCEFRSKTKDKQAMKAEEKRDREWVRERKTQF